jgi:putative glutamine amidotransferase
VEEESNLSSRPDRPRIVITVRRVLDGEAPAKVARSIRFYADAVYAAGGDPVVVAAGDPVPERFDGLLLAGGADVHPRHYGQAIDPRVADTLTIDEARDALELPLARQTLEADVPMLCICRGVQLVNVAAGGTLWQDLSLARIDPAAHDQDGRLQTWEVAHPALVDAGSRLADVVGDGTIGVNTFHHQAVAEPAPGFVVTARAPDGTIEGLESRHHTFVVGVQWHPERMVERHARHRALFERFVAAARGG